MSDDTPSHSLYIANECRSSTRFIIFDRYATIVASHQIEFPQYYPEPGWHEHDAEQIMESCDACIDQACGELETLGWTKESVKVIGAGLRFASS